MMRPSDFMQRNPVKLDVSRSKFEMNPRWTGTLNAYELTPIFTYSDILPGDTFKVSTSFVVRMSTPIVPVMDDLFLDVAFYFVPHELILSRSYMSPSTNDSNHSWKAFIGAQDSLLNMPIPDSDISLPNVKIDFTSYKVRGIADCMGISAPASGSYLVNCLAPLAFMAVWNENYREPNTENPGVFAISGNSCYFTWPAVNLSGATDFGKAPLPHVCRFHGYFGSALPWPQRNSETVLLPLGTEAPLNVGSDVTEFDNTFVTDVPLRLKWDRTFASNGGYYAAFTGYGDSLTGISVRSDTNDVPTSGSIIGTNLVADLSKASAVSINVFRLAVQEQRWYEALARGGNRIDELTAALFGVMPKDAGGNQPEYLGGKRIPLEVSQVNVTANGSEGNNSKVGQTGAFSLTSDNDYYFTKSFDKWGSIIGVACIRYRDSFGESLNRMFTRHERFDWYFPAFANLGEQPLFKHEISIYSNTANADYPKSDVFGYQEAWADFRTIPDIVTGLVRPGKSLDHWTYANTAAPTAGNTMLTTLAGFLQANNAKNAIDRTLEVSSDTAGFQFLAQFQHSIIAVRPMPMYSIPGLVDHH